jgi:expansin (peptidoglycan-binding protein)
MTQSDESARPVIDPAGIPQAVVDAYWRAYPGGQTTVYDEGRKGLAAALALNALAASNPDTRRATNMVQQAIDRQYKVIEALQARVTKTEDEYRTGTAAALLDATRTLDLLSMIARSEKQQATA